MWFFAAPGAGSIRHTEMLQTIFRCVTFQKHEPPGRGAAEGRVRTGEGIRL